MKVGRSFGASRARIGREQRLIEPAVIRADAEGGDAIGDRGLLLHPAVEQQRERGPGIAQFAAPDADAGVMQGKRGQVRDERKIRHLTHDQFETFYDSVVAPHARLYVLLGLYTMARPTAILDLTWDRVDFERGLVDLNPAGRRQTAKRRPVVPMSDDLREALESAVKARQTSYVIERGAKRIHSMKKAFQAASQRSGIHVTPYMLRHTGAVWAAEQGMSMTELAQFMGHDDDRTTQMHYARYSPEHLRRVANAVQRKKK